MKPCSPSASRAGQRSSPLGLNRLLAPIDFSPRSRQAARYAGSLARQFGAALDLMFAVEPAPFYSGLEYTPLTIAPEELARTAQDRLRKLAATEVGDGVPVRVLVVHGKAGDQIVAVARQRRADLIVMSTHGYTGVERVVMGSTAEAVIRQAPCPVLTLRRGAVSRTVAPIRRILAPVDFSAPSRQALDYALGFARRLGAAVTAFHCVQSPASAPRSAALVRRLQARILEEAREELANWAAGSAGGARLPAVEVRAGTPRDEILRAVERLETDLVIMATRGRSSWARWLLGSVAESVVRHASCPVLVVSAPLARRAQA